MSFGYYARFVYYAFKELVVTHVRTTYTGHGARSRIGLTTGGFVEIELSNDHKNGIGFVRIHLGKPKRVHYLDETYKYVRYGINRDNLDLLIELRNALNYLMNDQLGS